MDRFLSNTGVVCPEPVRKSTLVIPIRWICVVEDITRIITKEAIHEKEYNG